MQRCTDTHQVSISVFGWSSAIVVGITISLLARHVLAFICTTRFDIQKFCVLSTHCIYVFCMDLRTSSDYFRTQINWLVFITETECVYCAVRTESLNITQFNFRLSRVNVRSINIHYNRTKFSDCDATNKLVKSSRLKVVQSLRRVCGAPYIENPVYVATTMMRRLNTIHNLSIG